MSDKIQIGTFDLYSIKGGIGDSTHGADEDAVDMAFETMLQLCGNAGQERLIGDCMEYFYNWALGALEEAAAPGTYFNDFANSVYSEWYAGRGDKWWGTAEIWAQGWTIVAQQSGYHDAGDEVGEGIGQEFQ